jgi:iron complex transport system substrate-binding protein
MPAVTPALTMATTRRAWLIGAGFACAARTTWASAERRIVSIGGALTETLYALGAQGDLVGADTTSLFPEAAQRLPSVGYARALSAEGVLSLRPTLVVASQEAGPPAVLRQIEAARVPLALLDADHRFEGVVARTQRLAELCGQVEPGRALVADLQQRWAQVQDQLARRTASGKPAPRALFVLSHSMAQVRVSGSGTAADAMLRYAGAVNVLGSVEGYKPLTPEAAIAAAPEVILVTEQGLQAAGGIDGLLKAPGLAQTPAGRARRVVALEALLLLGFGPRLPQAVAALANALHGKAA